MTDPVIEEIQFDSSGTRCKGVHVRGGGDAFTAPDGRRPCVILGHGACGTVDSGLLRFAEGFARAGLDALAFDYRHFGNSDGRPRQLLSPQRQVADYLAAARYARSLPGVDPDRIVLWGLSISGGHVIRAAAEDCRIAAVISQVPALNGVRSAIHALPEGSPRDTLRLFASAIRDRVGSFLGRPPVMAPLIAGRGEPSMLTSESGRAEMEKLAGPTWRNEVTARFALSALALQHGRSAPKLPCPVLVQVALDDEFLPAAPMYTAAASAPHGGEVRTYPMTHVGMFFDPTFEGVLHDQVDFLARHISA